MAKYNTSALTTAESAQHISCFQRHSLRAPLFLGTLCVVTLFLLLLPSVWRRTNDGEGTMDGRDNESFEFRSKRGEAETKEVSN